MTNCDDSITGGGVVVPQSCLMVRLRRAAARVFGTHAGVFRVRSEHLHNRNLIRAVWRIAGIPITLWFVAVVVVVVVGRAFAPAHVDKCKTPGLSRVVIGDEISLLSSSIAKALASRQG